MPPLKQPKSLAYMSQCSYAFWFAKSIHDAHVVSPSSLPVVLKSMNFYEHLTENLAAEMIHAVLQSSMSVIHHYSLTCAAGLNDSVVLKNLCDYLALVLKCVLHPRLKYLEAANLTIDMRTFGNFQV